MSTPNQLSLLRRTFAVLVAAAAFGAMSDANAQAKVKLNGGSKLDECTYSSMSITPDGGVLVQCSGTTTEPPPPPPPPPPVETYAMGSSAMTAPANSTATVPVGRAGPTGSVFAAATMYYWYTGNGCQWSDVGAVTFAAGQTSATISAPVTAEGTTCTVNLATPASPAVLGSPSTTVITVTAPSAPPPPPPPSNCPTGFVMPVDMVSSSLPGLGNPIFAMQKSGQVISIPLPNLNGLNTGQITFGESPTAVTPQPVTIEISINKCPGLIDSGPSSCNLRSTQGSYNSITWFAKAYSIITDATSANQRGYCWAGDADQYYVNARWTYQYCPLGAQVCGFAVQYNQGPY